MTEHHSATIASYIIDLRTCRNFLSTLGPEFCVILESWMCNHNKDIRTYATVCRYVSTGYLSTLPEGSETLLEFFVKS